MHISGERRLPFGRDLVWATLNDPVALKACVPGCDRFVAAGDNRYDAAFKAKVGPLRATIRGWVSVEDIVAPERYRLVAEGQGGVAGFAKAGAAVRLAADGAETVLVYDASAAIGGALGRIGAQLVKSSARHYAARFFDRLEAQIALRADASAA